jgi:hypothetical protein
VFHRRTGHAYLYAGTVKARHRDVAGPVNYQEDLRAVSSPHADLQTIPIPGSSKPDRVKDNVDSVNVKLSEQELKGIQGILDTFEPKGERYPAQAAAHLVSRHMRYPPYCTSLTSWQMQ